MVEIERTQIHISSDVFVAVAVVISYTSYCLSGGSYQEMVHCIVLNSPIAVKACNNRLKKKKLLLRIFEGNGCPDQTRAFPTDR